VLEQITGEVVSTQGKLSSMKHKNQNKASKNKASIRSTKSKRMSVMAKKQNTKQLTDGSYAMDGWSY